MIAYSSIHLLVILTVTADVALMRSMNSPTMTAVEANSGAFNLDAEKLGVGDRQKDQNQEDMAQYVDDISVLASKSENQEDGAKSVDEKRRKRYLRKSEEYRKTLVNGEKNIPTPYRTLTRVKGRRIPGRDKSLWSSHQEMAIRDTTGKRMRIPGRDKSLWSFHQEMAIRDTTGKRMRIPGRDKSLWSSHQKNTSHKADKKSHQPDRYESGWLSRL